MYDLNDAGTQTVFGDLIPDGTFVKLHLHIRPGGEGTGYDNGILKASKSSDAKMLDCELTVVDGPFAKRKLFQMFTVSGGNLDDKGVSKGWNITKPILRAMIDSCLGLLHDDTSPAAVAKRKIQGLKDLEGLKFAAKVIVEPGSPKPDGTFYSDKNLMERVIVVEDKQYADIMAGKPVPAEPANRKPKAPPPNNQPCVTQWSGGPATAVPAIQAPQWGVGPAAPAAAAPVAGPAWLNG